MRKSVILVAIATAVALFHSSPIQAAVTCDAEVNTAQGAVTGMEKGDPATCAYIGIPYARPPVGDMRWKPPAPALKRANVFPAVNFGPECVQKDMAPSYVMGDYKPERSEDCLYLNIWRPKKEGKFPVMFWIHGGGLVSGSGSEPMYRGELLAGKKDVVLVTFNYRLNIFGFLAHKGLTAEDEHSSSGNYGLLDQIAALKWVRNNIAAFGGDPDNVTIFGESAGGWSVCNLMASPLASDLFDKAILQSGGCDTVATMDEGYEAGMEFAERLGCSDAENIECMRSKTSDEILEVIEGDMTKRPVLELNMSLHTWVPHIDDWAMPGVQIDLLRDGDYNQVPLMIGSTRDEAKLFMAPSKFTYRRIRKSKIEAAIAGAFDEGMVIKFRELYPYDKYDRPMDALADAKGDVALGCRTFMAAEASAKYQPTWYYRFDYDDSRFDKTLGAAHAFELPFIFGDLNRPYYTMLYSKKQERRAQPLVDAMMSYWTNFAKSGNPNGPGVPEWPRYDLDTRMRMFLDLPIHVDKTDNVDKCAFWRTVNVR